MNNTNVGTADATWDISFVGLPSVNNVEMYGTQLKIPPHANGVSTVNGDWNDHTNSTYDTGSGTDVWWVISKASTRSNTANATTASAGVTSSKMILVYEYQGQPFNLTKYVSYVDYW